MTLIVRATAIACALVILLGTALDAQTGAGGGEWDVETEASASIFFGNTRQRLAVTRFLVGRSDSLIAVRTDGRYTYSESVLEGGAREVSRRSWNTSLTVDRTPYATWSPFVLGSAESSLERRIDLRYAGGAGAKYTFVRQPTREASFSLAMLGERTIPRDSLPAGAPASLLRWSARLRLRRAFDDRVTVSHTTFYRPAVREAGDFTVSSVTALAVSMTQRLSVSLSLTDNYDSEAISRGARSNNDGQMLFGILARF